MHPHMRITKGMATEAYLEPKFGVNLANGLCVIDRWVDEVCEELQSVPLVEACGDRLFYKVSRDESIVTQFDVEAVRRHIARFHPGCPGFAIEYIAKQVAAKTWQDATLGMAVGITMQNLLRHEMTDYDTLLLMGVDRAEARRRVQPRVDAMLGAWTSGQR